MKIILSILIFVSLPAWANQTTEGTGSTSMSPNNTINQGANRGSASQGSGKSANQMAGMAFGMLCMVGCSQISQYACYACPLAAMAIGQLGADGDAQKQSDLTADASFSGGGYNAAGTGTDTTYDISSLVPPGTDTSGAKPTSIKDISAALKSKGYTLNPDGSVKTPDGVLPADTFNSAAGMAKAGFSSAAIKAATAALEKVNKDIDAKYGGDRVVAVGVNSSAGGYDGGGGGSSGRSSSDSAFDEYLRKLRGGMGGDGSAKRGVAGKSINVGGEPVGVKGDDIFKMVERQYSAKTVRNEFIKPK